MIKQLTVKKLFNQNGNDFELNFFEDLNIITGRNGSGKTTIMKLLWYAISGHFDILIREIEFKELMVLTDKCTIKIESPNAKNPTYHLEIDYFENKMSNKDIRNFKFNPIIDEFHNTLFFPTFRRIEGGFTIIPKAGETVENNEIYESFNELSNRLSRVGIGINNHKFIAYVSTNDLDRHLNDESAYLDSERIKIKNEIDEKIRRLAKEGKNDEILKIMDESDKTLSELNRKFDVLHELVDKHLKKRILMTNKISFGTDKKNPLIQSQRLSAGEKQMFSFLCYNIFAKNSSIFIDEPEISLHPDWQRNLIPLLLKQASGNQFFMSTHSDLIAAPYPHREIELNTDKGR